MIEPFTSDRLSSKRRWLVSAGAAFALSACLSPRYDGSENLPGFGAGSGQGGGGSSVGGGLGGGSNSAGSGSELGPGQVMGPGNGMINTGGGTPPAQCLSSPPQFVTKVAKDPETDAALIARVNNMPLDQRIRQMYGFSGTCDYNAGSQCFEQQALQEQGLPLWPMRDGPRGVRRVGPGTATAFPVPVARAASFDIELEQAVGDAIGKQMLAFKYDLMLAPTVNTLRHPAWGRAQETYGEDTWVLGEMGAAFVRGVQAHVPTCIKHFAANTSEGNRETVSAEMDMQTLREVYVRQFQIAVEKSDPACFMASYNKLNGIYAAENELLLKTILRDEWKWKGFVISDWGAVKSTVPSALAGTDLEMPDSRFYGALLSQVQGGAVPQARISQAVRRILNIKEQYGQLTPAYQSRPLNENIQNEPAMLQLAQTAAEEGMVLLENKDNILPLRAPQGGPPLSILVVGPDGDTARIGDSGSSQVATNPATMISPFAGLRTRGMTSGAQVTYESQLGAAVTAAAGKSAVILVVSMQHSDEGEGYGGGDDRDSLDLNGPHPEHWPEGQKPRAWIQQLSAANPNLIVVLNVGSAILEPSLDSAKAVLYSFYPGQAGGTALARLLFGDVNFSGKLPFTIGTAAAQYPAFGDTGASAQFDYFHGYRKFDKDNVVPRYYFGSGRSYTSYSYSDLRVACSGGVSANGMLVAEVDVTNDGEVPGTEIVQLYVGYPNTTVRRSVKELKAFTRVTLAAKETKTVQLTVPARDFAYYDEARGWVVEPVAHQVLMGPSADPTKLLKADFNVLPPS
jgi:beta-glucosidase